jgi:hypothetical protein
MDAPRAEADSDRMAAVLEDQRVDRSTDRVWRVLALAALVIAMLIAGSTHRMAPQTDSTVYATTAQSIIAGHGYRTPAVNLEPTGRTRYPPGLPVLLVPAVWLFGTTGATVTAWLIGLLLVAAIWGLARELGGDEAATTAGVLTAASPLVVHSGFRIMADAPAALATLGVLWAVHRRRDHTAGIWMIAAFFLRLDALALLPMLGRRRKAWKIAIVGLGALAAFQLAIHGNLIGYSSNQASFGVRYLTGHTSWDGYTHPSIVPNWLFYPGVLAGAPQLAPGWGGVAPIVVLLLGAVGLWMRRHEALARSALCGIAATVALCLFYFFQSARFMIPVVSILIVFAGAAVSEVLGLSRRQRLP